jgi:bifunctional oligoribonuclease and PAP phosphatase NrnA
MEYASLRAQFAQPQKVVIVVHTRPDGDAMGSGLGLMHYLRSRGHQAQLIVPSAVPDYLRWMPGAAESLVGETQPDACLAKLTQAGWLFCLDFGLLSRTEGTEALLKQFAGTIVNIDHHLENGGFAQYVLRDTAASSTCELVYRYIQGLEDNTLPVISPQIATCLYTGIMTDTGSFRFETTTPAVHRTIADLIEAGAAVQRIHRAVYDSYSESRTRLLGYCLSEKMRVLRDYQTAYITLTLAEQERFGVQPGDTEGIVNYALGIHGVNFGAIMIEYPEQVKMSFRSVGSFSAAAFASNFAGGGHYNAAGGKSTDALLDTEARFLSLLPQYQAQLVYTQDA